ncbi:alpha/beta fold hydrolase [Nonomuraea ceibae]|uniref:alpha/beta fold hydrolase n=1 Tax=Nonomuraea ceibae TaxID=1935170 RepID=UPI0027E0BBAD|nr:alpha/beta hydrolase [Nonomuraea ceibae]
MNDTVTSADGTLIACTMIGSGPALVVVNGALAHRDSHPTEGILARSLTDRHTVITYDRRGRGASGPAGPALPAADAIAAEIADVAALIDLAGGKAAVLGLSSGAVLALEAVRAGLPITALALWEPPFVVNGARPPLGPGYRERLQRALAEGRPGDALAQFFAEAAGFPAEAVAPMRAEPFWAGMERLAPSLAHDAAVMGDTQSGDPAALDRFAGVGVPALVMYGGASEPWLAGAATALAAVLPDATLRELPGQDHDVAPDLLMTALTTWLPAY